MKNLTKFTAVMLSLYSFGAQAMVNVDALFANSVCTGENAVCNQTVTSIKGGGGGGALGGILGKAGGLLNAIAAEKFEVDSATSKVVDLGKIDADRDETLNISAKDNGYTIYSFVPADTGKKTYVAFRSSVPGAGKPGHGSINVNVYRQFAGEDSTAWTWRAGFTINLKKVTPNKEGMVTEMFTIGTDGNLQDPAGNKFATGGR